ncbi:glycoside hydrolase family 3 protein [Allopontixanthobacter sp.]|uniref:glycoside hydrolase family 3 protein n=1 Tax=Allopontixanthobacter sp. TaxID=2906452 RepID=UPI002ABAB4F8|nr:glycoside hydrolase family 3 N-terminal domain-containing protein [Allopontixanthobacter sp.]MDZ4307079.1 glycoside hydrolase family 3 N-terminal domain-containing protein [Allopontixanthobacter sp.]
MQGKFFTITCAILLASCTSSVSGESPLGAVADPANWPAASSPAAITSDATESRITDLLSRMTVEQKVGQLIQADISTITPEDLHTYQLGSILAGGNSGPYDNERGTVADWDRMVREFRTASLRPATNGIAIPIIFGVDAVHGHNNIPDATIFPHNIGLGAARDPEMIRRIGAATAAEVAGSGIEWTFAPTLAVPQDPRWGRTYEGYSSDPSIVAEYASAMVLGLQGTLEPGAPLQKGKVAATAKHFLADGGTLGGKDQGDAVIDESELVAVHAAGYPPAINAGALTVMASFSSWNGIKHHGNKSLLTDVLKDRMGFQGFVVGDWNGHGQVAACSVTDCAQSINAGLDMFMAPDSWKGLYETTLRQARDGTIPRERLDDAVRRILRVKLKLDLLDNPMQDRSNYAAIGAPDHLALAREAVRKSLVMLKNNGGILPIRAGANVLVTGPAADNIAIQSGGWTISWQGTDVTADDFKNGRTIWQGLSDAVRAAGGTAQLAPDGQFTARPDVAIVVFGERPYAEFQGDVPTLDYQPSGAQDLALIKRLKAQGIPVVSVFLSGRPMFTSPEINASEAFVAAWLPGTQGQGLADVLVAPKSGEPAYDFTGKLPFRWPSDASYPIDEPLFDRGYGLTYAKPGEVGVLSEDPGIDLAKAMNVENYFAAGRAAPPWTLSVTDTGGKRPVEASSAVSPAGEVTVKSVDVNAQEDGKAFVFKGAGSVSIEGPPANLRSQFDDGAALRIDWRIDAKGTGTTALVFGDRAVSLANWLAAAPTGSVGSLVIPLRCFADNAAELETVGNAFRVEGNEGLAFTLLAVRIDAAATDSTCPPAWK